VCLGALALTVGSSSSASPGAPRKHREPTRQPGIEARHRGLSREACLYEKSALNVSRTYPQAPDLHEHELPWVENPELCRTPDSGGCGTRCSAPRP
jgi:hypothetical protein